MAKTGRGNGNGNFRGGSRGGYGGRNRGRGGHGGMQLNNIAANEGLDLTEIGRLGMAAYTNQNK
jgi:hypothetical protein